VELALARAQRRTGVGGLLEEVECHEHAEEVSSSVDRSRLLSSPLPSGVDFVGAFFLPWTSMAPASGEA